MHGLMMGDDLSCDMFSSLGDQMLDDSHWMLWAEKAPRKKTAAKVGLADHVTVGPKAQIAAKSGVMRDIAPGSIVMGYPAKNIRKFLKENK